MKMEKGNFTTLKIHTKLMKIATTIIFGDQEKK